MPVRSHSARQWRSTAGGSYVFSRALAGRGSAIGAVGAGGLDQLPDPLGSGRDVDVLDAELAQRIPYGISHRRYGANGAGLADSFHAERIGRRRRHRAMVLHHRQTVGAHRRIISQRAADQLSSLLVVNDLLPQRLCRSLGDPALYLAVHQQWVDHVTAVVNADVLDESNLARVHIDVDHRNVRTEWEREVRRIEYPRELQARLHTLRELPRVVRLACDFGERQAFTRRTLDLDLALHNLHVVWRDFQK